jgi:hypothetical protein
VAATRHHPPQKKNQAKTRFRKAYTVALRKGTTRQSSSNVPPSNKPYWNYDMPGHSAKNYYYPNKRNNNQRQGNANTRSGCVYFTTLEEIPLGEVVTTGKFLVNQHPIVLLFDSGASHSFMSPTFASKYVQKVTTIDKGGYYISAARNNISTNQIVKEVCIEIGGRVYIVDLIILLALGIDVILRMKWMSGNGVLIDTSTRVVMLRDPINKKAFLVPLPRDIDLHNVSTIVQAKTIANVPVVCEFSR